MSGMPRPAHARAAAPVPVPVTLVRVEPADWAGHRDLRLEALRTTPEAFGSRYEVEVRNDEAEWRARIGRIAFWQARIEGAPAGMAGLWEDSTSAEPPTATGASATATGTAYLIAMYVRPQARGLGIGVRLVRAIVSEAARRGHRRLLLQVASTNTAARALYAGLGFVSIDAPPREPDDRCDLVLACPVPPE